MKCSYKRCGHRPCENCDLYEYDHGHKGDWSFWLGTTSVYDHSKVTYEELLVDERLHSFIIHFALDDEPRDHLVRDQNWGTPERRTAIVRDLIESYTHL
jgi:hypothetical protein